MSTHSQAVRLGIAAVGDTQGDGYDDLLVGDPDASDRGGRIRIYRAAPGGPDLRRRVANLRGAAAPETVAEVAGRIRPHRSLPHADDGQRAPFRLRRRDPRRRGRLRPRARRRCDISEALHTLSFLFIGGRPPGCLEAADSNDDGALDIGDPITTLVFLFLGDKTPAAPGPFQCAADPGDSPHPSCDSHDRCR